MPKVAVKVILKGEPTIETVLNEKPGEQKEFKTARLETVGILEKGMVSGATSIMMYAITEKGEHIIIETSAAIWDGVSHAIKGAEYRFKHK